MMMMMMMENLCVAARFTRTRFSQLSIEGKVYVLIRLWLFLLKNSFFQFISVSMI